jgi:WhiB family redox-sensing transcriptional regulator
MTWPSAVDHGTNNGYFTHYKTRIPVCEPCRDAHSDYAKERRDRIFFDWSWRLNAACIDSDPRIFQDTEQPEAALAVCRSCPVVNSCKLFRVELQRRQKVAVVGVWGGRVWLTGNGVSAVEGLKAKAGSLT